MAIVRLTFNQVVEHSTKSPEAILDLLASARHPMTAKGRLRWCGMDYGILPAHPALCGVALRS